MKLIGMDVGSTTVKAVAVEWRAAAEGEASGYEGKQGLQVVWQDYQRHNTRQAEKVLEFLGRMEDEALASTGLSLEGVRAYVDKHPEMKRATYRVPHGDAVGTAANMVLHVAKKLGRG